MKKQLLILAAMIFAAFPALAAGVQGTSDEASAIEAPVASHADVAASLTCEAIDDRSERDAVTMSCQSQCASEYEQCEDRCYNQSSDQDELSYCLDDCASDAMHCFSQC